MSDVTKPFVDRRRDIYEQRFNRIEDQLSQIGASLVLLARIEERHLATNERMVQHATILEEHNKRVTELERAVPPDLGKRLAKVELSMPGLKELRRWIITGVIGVLGIVGTAAVALVIVPAHPIPQVSK